MAGNDSSLRLKFLQNSANYLSAKGGSTAAHLMTLHNRLVHADLKPLKPRQHETWCAACGSFRDNAHSNVSKTKRKITVKKPESESREILEETIIYHCSRCHKRTMRRLQSHIRSRIEPSGIAIETQPKNVSTNKRSSTVPPPASPSPSASTTSSAAQPVSDNASSKRRAKARKQSGLQALMASKQRSQASDAKASLDLLDFLQQ